MTEYETANAAWQERDELVAELLALKAENERLRCRLEDAAESMTCKGNGPDAAHYCPNCSTNMYGPRERARRALERKPE
jgi:regulator of replication initiation timing